VFVVAATIALHSTRFVETFQRIWGYVTEKRRAAVCARESRDPCRRLSVDAKSVVRQQSFFLPRGEKWKDCGRWRSDLGPPELSSPRGYRFENELAGYWLQSGSDAMKTAANDVQGASFRLVWHVGNVPHIQSSTTNESPVLSGPLQVLTWPGLSVRIAARYDEARCEAEHGYINGGAVCPV